MAMILRWMAALILIMQPAWAQRGPTEPELMQIEQAMRAAGYTSWGAVTLSEDAWEVEDARKPPLSCDVSLNANTYGIVDEECE
jgi:hypothetical protein